MTPMRLEPTPPRSRVKHSTTEPLRSLTHAKSSVRWSVIHFGRGLQNVSFGTNIFDNEHYLFRCLMNRMQVGIILESCCL